MFTINKDTVLRDGEAIGTISEGIVTLTVPLAPAHKGRLKKELPEVTSFVAADAEAEEANIPPCPAEDPLKGDKTPAVVEWYHDHKPEEYKTKYANRRTHLGALA
jgi:hypothetical protein